MMLRNITVANQHSNFSKDDGWELFYEKVEGYMDGNIPVEFARRRCGWNEDAEVAGIPREFYEKDLSKFEFKIYKENLENLKKVCWGFVTAYDEWRGGFPGVFIWNETSGSGKTLLAVCMSRSSSIKNNLRLRFIESSKYAMMAVEAKKREYGAHDFSEIYRTCDLLVLDNIDAKMNQWEKEKIEDLVDERFKKSLLTIFTSNTKPEDLTFSKNAVGLLIDKSVVLKLPDEPVRRRKKEERQKQFIEKLIGRV